jgi:transcription-repair coupling factor (superfamily II helicase)
MNFLINPLHEINEYQEVLKTLKSSSISVSISGPSDSQKAHICYGICSDTGRKGMLVAFNEMQARILYEDLQLFLGEEVVFFPSKEVMLHDVEAKSYDEVFQRIRALDRIVEKKYTFVVTSAEAISHKLVPRQLFEECIMRFELGERIDFERLLTRLVAMGYERVDTVEAEGQFAVRGGIVDIFSVNMDYAVRIELFDDEVDSIRLFDPQSQRSIDKLDCVRIIPAREVIYMQGQKEKIISRIESELASQLDRIRKRDKKSDYANQLEHKINSDIEKIGTDYYFPGIDRYIPFIIENAASLVQYMDSNTLIFVDEPVRVKQRIENILLENDEACKALIEKGMLIQSDQKAFFDYESLIGKLAYCKTILLNTINSRGGGFEPSKNFTIPSRTMNSYQGHMELLSEDINNWKKGNNRVVIFSGTRGRGERLVDTLCSEGIESIYSEDYNKDMQPGQIIVTHGSLNKGFEYPSIGVVVVSDKEVFGQDRKGRKPAVKNRGKKISLFTDLNVGDFVVHQVHGIGQYVGIETLVVEGVKKDYLKIRYREGGYLYIPTNQLDLIQKYIGSENKVPRLNKLGGNEWSKAKKKVKESLMQLAGELIKLYAQRQSTKGFAFSKDAVWQRQFEEQFPYDETDDQIKCIEEIKHDMESERVMDRLLCGDVGYGKTEVAIRAIFKAVMDGKQVAYLVPTTVLAQQQYNNFKSRMEDFPIAVEVMSRFRTSSEQKRIIKDIKSGMVDIVVGTHRLLQKDIQFKNLGLLVVDEEQRFGVSHKEKLKNIRPNVDVLTLTATPIPRTLHMSLVGIRDISVIEDPPEDRYPVQTYVMEYERDVIRDAIIREMSRGGQVFYLYNRVRSIDIKALDIQNLVPEARVAVAHGQMQEGQLEEIMLAFINGEYDVLACTTIIESGLDMPNVNTIIIEDADRMGLAQLYQLRGRVGRSNRLAYAYITYRKDKVVSEIAQKRLQAIREFTEFGSGFKIAMRDMEIRGAGNLLGPEQHGHMESVGYDMYCRLLDEAVRELKGESPAEDESEIAIDVNVSAYIDSDYISVESRKIEMYKKVASITDEQDIIDIEDELIDRYGDMPRPVRNLLDIAQIKLLAKSLGISSVSEKNESIIFQVGSGKHINIKSIAALTAKYRRKLLFNAGSSPYLMYRITDIPRDKLLDNIKIVLHDIKSFEV